MSVEHGHGLDLVLLYDADVASRGDTLPATAAALEHSLSLSLGAES